MKYKIGDKVKIVKEIYGHDFEMGEIVAIINAGKSGDLVQYVAENLSKTTRCYIYEDEIEPFYDNFDEDFNAYEDKPPTKAEMHRRICEELTKTYVKKNTDYGDSYGQLRARYPDSILIRVFDKFSRLERLLKGNKALVEDESIEDTLLDLANYAIMEVVERRRG